MSIDKIFVTIFGLASIVSTYWFFLMKKDEFVEIKNSVDITVDGGYTPNAISIPKGKTTQIHFLRKDPNTCLEEVVLSDFKIRKYLPMNKKITISITPDNEGTYDFVCGMGMFHGKIMVR
jgi:plastocyanin domain-containing protein